MSKQRGSGHAGDTCARPSPPHARYLRCRDFGGLTLTLMILVCCCGSLSKQRGYRDNISTLALNAAVTLCSRNFLNDFADVCAFCRSMSKQKSPFYDQIVPTGLCVHGQSKKKFTDLLKSFSKTSVTLQQNFEMTTLAVKIEGSYKNRWFKQPFVRNQFLHQLSRAAQMMLMMHALGPANSNATITHMCVERASFLEGTHTGRSSIRPGTELGVK